MVFKRGCIRPCERKGKIQANIHFYHVKMRRHYQTHIRIFIKYYEFITITFLKIFKKRLRKIRRRKIIHSEYFVILPYMGCPM